jgi:outer membrane protease
MTAVVVLVSIIFFAQPLQAQEKLNESYAFSIGPIFGMLYDQAEEIVYPDNSSFKAKLLSQLLWDMKPVFYNGLLLDFSQVEPLKEWGFFSNLSLKCGIPGLSGKMEDRDWMSIRNADLTHFSEHDNTTKELFILDFSAGFSFPLQYGFLFKTFAGVSYKHFSFFGMGGYLKYAREIGGRYSGIFASIDDNPIIVKIPNGEKVINYTQDWLVFAPGVSFRYYILQQFFVEISFQISPFILCADVDKHLEKNIEFRDYLRDGLFTEPELRLSYITEGRLEVSLSGSWQKIWGSRGPTYSSPIGKKEDTMTGEAGTGLSLLDISLLAKIRI